MRCLSLTQPWASLVSLGLKTFETRGWTTDYRGPLLIHASARFPSACIALCYEEPFYSALQEAGIKSLSELPLGAIIAATSIEGLWSTKTALEHQGLISGREFSFGDYGPRRYAFQLGPVSKTRVVPCAGALSLWKPTAATLEALGLSEIETAPPLLTIGPNA